MNALAKPKSPEAPAPSEPKMDLSRYTGAQKATIILLCLGEEAKTLWSLLDED